MSCATSCGYAMAAARSRDRERAGGARTRGAGARTTRQRGGVRCPARASLGWEPCRVDRNEDDAASQLQCHSWSGVMCDEARWPAGGLLARARQYIAPTIVCGTARRARARGAERNEPRLPGDQTSAHHSSSSVIDRLSRSRTVSVSAMWQRVMQCQSVNVGSRLL